MYVRVRARWRVIHVATITLECSVQSQTTDESYVMATLQRGVSGPFSRPETLKFLKQPHEGGGTDAEQLLTMIMQAKTALGLPPDSSVMSQKLPAG